MMTNGVKTTETSFSPKSVFHPEPKMNASWLSLVVPLLSNLPGGTPRSLCTPDSSICATSKDEAAQSFWKQINSDFSKQRTRCTKCVIATP